MLIHQPGRGVTLHIPEPLDIVLGQTTAQDLLLDLGPPLRKFYKEDNRLERMWAATESPEGSCEFVFRSQSYADRRFLELLPIWS